MLNPSIVLVLNTACTTFKRNNQIKGEKNVADQSWNWTNFISKPKTYTLVHKVLKIFFPVSCQYLIPKFCWFLSWNKCYQGHSVPALYINEHLEKQSSSNLNLDPWLRYCRKTSLNNTLLFLFLCARKTRKFTIFCILIYFLAMKTSTKQFLLEGFSPGN